LAAGFSQDEEELDDMLFSDSESANDFVQSEKEIPVDIDIQNPENSLCNLNIGHVSGKNRLNFL